MWKTQLSTFPQAQQQQPHFFSNPSALFITGDVDNSSNRPSLPRKLDSSPGNSQLLIQRRISASWDGYSSSGIRSPGEKTPQYLPSRAVSPFGYTAMCPTPSYSTSCSAALMRRTALEDKSTLCRRSESRLQRQIEKRLRRASRWGINASRTHSRAPTLLQSADAQKEKLLFHFQWTSHTLSPSLRSHTAPFRAVLRTEAPVDRHRANTFSSGIPNWLDAPTLTTAHVFFSALAAASTNGDVLLVDDPWWGTFTT